MGQLWFDEDADAALTRLEDDPTLARLRVAVDGVLDQLETDPGHESVRRIRFNLQGLWCVTVQGDGHHWAVLWEPHPEVDGDVMVQYLGPASFA